MAFGRQVVGSGLQKLPYILTTVNILLFFRYPKKRGIIVIRKSNEHQIGFLKIFKTTFQALKWVFVFPKGQKSTTVNREENFFFRKGHVGYQKICLFT
jgi:hypothetical protein